MGGWSMLSLHTNASALPFSRSVQAGGTVPRGAWNPAFHTVVFMANLEVVPKVVQDLDSGFSRRLHNTISTPRFFVVYIAEELEVHTQALFC